ncbi:unnamed protein product [Parnassius mnemosyne]|uniref:RNA-directed DNA polymerase n=1 Tax=Parnassius mnemosyne TaxID=213953 RepID=A0AAV1KS04_9NEOP
MPFEWGVEQDKARQYIIDRLTNEPILAIYDPQLPTEVHTDASAIGYGAVLIQIHEGELRRAVAYFSKSTQGAEPKYHSYELETLAVVKALQNFRKYLLGVPFKIVTDCNALKLTERKKDLLPRVARWWLSMQDFQYTFAYRKGSLMSHADYLSRNPVEVCHIQNPKNWAKLAQSADEETLNLIDKFNNGQLDSSRYVLRNGLLYVKYFPIGEESRLLCYIPKGFRLSLLHVFHDDQDHIGYDKAIELILHHFWFPGLRPFVRKYLKHCIVCLSHKRVPRASHQPIESWTKPDLPFSVVHMDTLGPSPESQGYKHVLIIIDAFTKYCLLYSLRRQDTDELKRAFTNAVSMFGSPRLLVADRGRMFESAAFQDMVSSFGSDIHFITPNMHHENGQAERYCRTLLNLLRIEVNHRGQSWSDVLWKTQLILNSTKHSTTNMSPLQLLIGSDTSTPVIRALVRDVAIDIATPNREALIALRRHRVSSLLSTNQQKQDDRINKGRRSLYEFEVNDKHRYKLELLAGSYGKRTEAAAENMVPWAGEWTPETCAAFFDSESDDSLHDNSEEAEARSVLENIKVADEDDRLSGEAVL